MTTPVYGIRRWLNGEPLAEVGNIMNAHADALEAALIAGGMAVPGAASLADLAAKTLPGTWQPMVLAAGWGRYEAESYPPLGYRLENGRVFLRGWLTTTAAKTAGQPVLATTAGGTTTAFVPAAYRPTYQHTLVADDYQSGVAGVKYRMQIFPDGNLFTFGAVASGLSIWLGGLSWPVAS